MSTLTANEIITQKHVRGWIQLRGPGNPISYAGTDTQYMYIQGITHPYGDISPVNVPDPRATGRYRTVATTIDAPDIISATLMVLQKRGAVPAALGDRCSFNYYLSSGCGDLSNPTAWTDYLQVFSGLRVTEVDHGDVQANDGDEMLSDSYSVVMADEYKIGALSFGEVAGTEVTREVVDVAYGSPYQCGAECGGIDLEGTEWIYALVADDVTSFALQAYVTYSTDSGNTWTNASITGIGEDEQVYALDIVGSKVVVIGTDAYYYASIDQITGAVGSFTKVTTGFVAAKSPRDLYVLGTREVFIVGLGGYIYKSQDITTGVSVVSAGSVTTENLARIAGDGENEIVAVGASGTVVRSSNRGRTFALTPIAPSADDVISVAVPSINVIWVGTDAGELYYTSNGGATAWTEKVFAGSGAGRVDDILFATRERAYFAHSSATPVATIFATWDGGNYWFSGSDANMLGVPTFGRANRMAVPLYVPSQTAANNLAVAGLSSGGTDGVIYLAIAPQS